MKLAAIFILSLLHGSVTYAQGTPKIEFEYAAIFDMACSQELKFAISETAVLEAIQRNQEFQAKWDSESGPLLRELFSSVGRGFYRSELTLYTSICKFIPMSQPFLLNVRPYLKSINSAPAPVVGVVQMVFHEFIHKYLVSTWDWTQSALLYKYRNESPSVKSHLHLMALEKFVYVKLGRKDLLELAERVYTTIIGGDYKRSWEIIAKDGYLPFVEELRKAPKQVK